MPIYNSLVKRPPANRLAYPDTLSATPRNEYIGALADFLAKSYSPERTQQMQGTARFLGAPAISQTLDRLSYGEPLTTGAGGLGGTTRIRPEALEAGMTVAPMIGPSARAGTQAAMVVGRAGERYAERVVPQIMEGGGLGAEILNAVAGQQSRMLPQAGRSGFGAFDPRYDPRIQEQARMQALVRDVQLNPNAVNPSTVSLDQFAGRPFITSMADRTAAGGKLMGIDNVQFNRPVDFLGGQDYMFNNPGLVWSSGNAPANALIKNATEIKSVTGQNPIYVPWRMAPTGGDFAQFTGETMLAYADAAMGKGQKKKLDKAIEKFIPDWSGVSNPASVTQFREASDSKRKAIKAMMDRDFRNEGGLNIGSARLAVSDPAQLAAQEGGIQNVGEIFAGMPLMKSSHPAYPGGVQGQGLGTLSQDHNIFELLPEVVKARGIPNPQSPRATDLRALQMKPYSGVITDDLLKRLGY
jgi:hypothetical protein